MSLGFVRELLVCHGHVVALVLVLAAALSGALSERALRAFLARVRWRARTAQRTLERRRGIDVGTVGSFTGVLRVEGRAAECFEGRPCAVATAAARPTRSGDFASTSTRADRLVLEIDGQHVVLLGEIEVVAPGPTGTTASRSANITARIVTHAGAENAWPFDELPTELRRVGDGERVEVAGRVVCRAGETGGYRVAASGLAIEGEGGALLVTPVRATGPRPWRGAGAAAVLALIVTGLAADAGTRSAEFVSPLHRTHALSVITDWDVERLTHAQREARLLLLDEHDHAGRAATLRALARMDGALAEARRGSDVASAREALVTLLRMPHGAPIVEAWLTLASRVDTACRKTDVCKDHAHTLELTRTPGRWGTSGPNHNLLGVLFSDESAHAHGRLTILMGRGLLAREGKGQIVTQLRARWLLEYAAVLIQLGDPDGAGEALSAVERSTAELHWFGAARLRRDTDDLREVIVLRASATVQDLRCTGCRDPGWCGEQRRIEDSCDPRRSGRLSGSEGWSELPLGFSMGLRTAVASGLLLSSAPDDPWGASRSEYARWLVPYLGLAARASLAVRLADPRGCEALPTVAGVVRERSRERALDALGAHAASQRVRECVERGRRALLGGT